MDLSPGSSSSNLFPKVAVFGAMRLGFPCGCDEHFNFLLNLVDVDTLAVIFAGLNTLINKPARYLVTLIIDKTTDNILFRLADSSDKVKSIDE